jgi:hypothetical protein
VYKTWFWLDAVKKTTIVGGTQLTPLAGPNLLIPKSFRHLFEVLLVYKTWFWLDAVEKTTIVGGTQVSNATKYTMTRYVDAVNHTQGHSLKTTKTHAPLNTDYNLHNFGSNNNSHLACVNQTISRMLRNCPEICSDRRILSRISFASDYQRRWSWILPPAWLMMPMPGSIQIPKAMIFVQVLLDLPLM